MYWGLKGGILNIADYDPLGYELSCCDSLCQVFLNFIISRSQRTVMTKYLKVQLNLSADFVIFDQHLPAVSNYWRFNTPPQYAEANFK